MRLTSLSSVIVVFAFLATGCSNPQTLPGHSLQVDNLERRYYLFVPQTPPETAMPLVVAFHGGGMIGEEFPQQAQFEALAESEGILLAFPQGLQVGDNEGEWQLNTRPESRHDIEFVSAMIEDISRRHSVESNRIYAVGYSLGSMFTYEVACQMSDRFAAITSFAGTMPQSPADCTPERYAPIMHVHGDADGIISYGDTWGWKSWDEVGTMMDIPSLINFWKDTYACQEANRMESSSSEHIIHSGCEQNAMVEHHRLKGVDHGWPEDINGESTHQVMWSFLSRFSL